MTALEHFTFYCYVDYVDYVDYAFGPFESISTFEIIKE